MQSAVLAGRDFISDLTDERHLSFLTTSIEVHDALYLQRRICHTSIIHSHWLNIILLLGVPCQTGPTETTDLFEIIAVI